MESSNASARGGAKRVGLINLLTCAWRQMRLTQGFNKLKAMDTRQKLRDSRLGIELVASRNFPLTEQLNQGLKSGEIFSYLKARGSMTHFPKGL